MSAVYRRPMPAREALSRANIALRALEAAPQTPHAGAATAQSPALRGAGAAEPAATHGLFSHKGIYADKVGGFFTLMEMLLSPHVRPEAFAGFCRTTAHSRASSGTPLTSRRASKSARLSRRGFGLGYGYHLHEYGTFTSFLAADFSRIAREGAATDGSLMPPSFRDGGFLELVPGRDIDWLCVATAVVHERGLCEAGMLQSRIEGIVVHYDRGLVRRVMESLDAAMPRHAGGSAGHGDRP